MRKIKDIRRSKGFTQEQLSKILKISPEHLSSIELGRRNPSWSVAQRLEKFFSIPASELLAESEEEVPGKVIGDD